MPTATVPSATLDARRAAGVAGTIIPFSGERREWPCNQPQLRSSSQTRDGKEFIVLEGYAATVDTPYRMWDWYGEYDEVVDSAAFDTTLAAAPDVAFLLNHKGMTMARTTAGTLELSVDETGLFTRSWLNPSRSDVIDLVHAVDDADVTEMSFAFRIVRGAWSPDYTEYRILEVDLDRGDVSAVNYGANPNTSISARAQQALTAIEHLDGAPLAAAAARATARLAEQSPTSQVTGRNAATLRALLELEDEL